MTKPVTGTARRAAAKDGAPGAPVEPLGKADGIILLNRWLKAAAAILGADAGCVLVNDGKIVRILARHNIPHAFMATAAQAVVPPYRMDETVILSDATNRPDIHAFLGTMALPRTGFFYRRPLSLKNDRTIALLLLGENPRPATTESELAIAGEIATAMTTEIERHYPEGIANVASSLGMTRAEIDSWMGKTDLPAALFDANLVLVSVNDKLRSMLPLNWGSAIGRPLDGLNLPARSSLDFLFRHAIAQSISTPCIDLTLQDSAGEGLPGMLRVVGAPVSPIDGGSYLIVTIDPANVTAAPPFPAAAIPPNQGQNVTTEFLLETLVRRRALRSRKDISYVTLRSWRQTIRSHQIRALRAIKNLAPETIAAEIAAEIRDDVMSLFGVGNFRAVVPMPCGHSPVGKCLSVAIAQVLGRDLGLPVIHALALPPLKGTSHPKTNVKRPQMTMVRAVDGPVLLIDDVATSGQHIEEATRLLRTSGAGVLAIAWIGGDSDHDDAHDADEDV